jgi:hypothetical protein
MENSSWRQSGRGIAPVSAAQRMSLFDICTRRMRRNQAASIAANMRAKLLPDCHHWHPSPGNYTNCELKVFQKNTGIGKNDI